MLSWTDGTNTELSAYRGAEWHRATSTTNGTLTRYLYDGDNVVADIDSLNSVYNQYVTPFLDENLSVTDVTGTPVTHYYTQDGLGSVRTLLTSAEAVANKYGYTAFGEEYAPATTTTVAQRYTFTGREKSGVGAPMYYRYRNYTPGLGRFGSRWTDYEKTPNCYDYQFNRPTMLRDPMGDPWPLMPYGGFWRFWGGRSKKVGVVVASDWTPVGDIEGWARRAKTDSRVDYVYRAGPGNKSFVEKIMEGADKIRGNAPRDEDHGIKYLWLSGHGVTDHVGVTTKIGIAHRPGRWERFASQTITEEGPRWALRIISSRMSKSGFINICSCGGEDTEANRARVKRQTKEFANRIGKEVTVCACSGEVSGTCHCEGTWICSKASKKPKPKGK
jgi:RHS repeat-associated protein